MKGRGGEVGVGLGRSAEGRGATYRSQEFSEEGMKGNNCGIFWANNCLTPDKLYGKVNENGERNET